MEIDTLKCRRIEIVDENGKCHIAMSAGPTGSYIVLMGEKNPLLQINTSKTGTFVTFMNEEHSTVRLGVGVSENGDAGIGINDPKGYPKMEIGYHVASNKGTIRCDGIAERGFPEPN